MSIVTIKINDVPEEDEEITNEESGEGVEESDVLIDSRDILPSARQNRPKRIMKNSNYIEKEGNDHAWQERRVEENHTSFVHPSTLPNILVEQHDSQETGANPNAKDDTLTHNEDPLQPQTEDSGVNDDDDDDIASHFQATVLKRGSVTVERKRPVSPRRRASKNNPQSFQEIEPPKPISNMISPLSRLTAQTKKKLPKQSIAQSPEHAKCLSLAHDRMKTQIPRSLELDIRDEVFSVLQETAQAYKRLLGIKHHLTAEAYDYINSW